MNAPENRSGLRARVVIYGKPGCCLCDEALEELEKVRVEIDFDLVEVDIQADPAIYDQMVESIPVIEIDGVRFCEFRVDETQLKNKLKEIMNHASPR